MNNDSDTVTIEFLAQQANCTWRTAKKRLVAHGIKPVSSNKKSELYDLVEASRAVMFPDERDLEGVDRTLGFIGASLIPAVWGTHSLFFRCLLGALRQRGATKAEALLQTGELLYCMTDDISRHCLPGAMKIETPDWLAQAAADFPDLTGLKLMEAYVEKHWPDV